MSVLLEVILLLSLFGSAFSAPISTLSPPHTSLRFNHPIEGFNLHQITDKFLFDISLNEFINVRNRGEYKDRLEWKSNGCSMAPDKPFGYNFKDACNRHDFGYRNYKRQSRFNHDSRKRIDKKFYKDMLDQCQRSKGKKMCKKIAWGYYEGTRAFG